MTQQKAAFITVEDGVDDTVAWLRGAF